MDASIIDDSPGRGHRAFEARSIDVASVAPLIMA